MWLKLGNIKKNEETYYYQENEDLKNTRLHVKRRETKGNSEKKTKELSLRHDFKFPVSYNHTKITQFSRQDCYFFYQAS